MEQVCFYFVWREGVTVIPIIIDGVTCGRGELQREGAYLVFRGRAKWKGGLVRLWLYGQGKPVYLGVLQPDGSLRRRFGASEIPLLPMPVTSCGNRPHGGEQKDISETDVLWFDQGDGTLLRQQGNKWYMALPACDLRLPRGCEGMRREIEGNEYVIFPC